MTEAHDFKAAMLQVVRDFPALRTQIEALAAVSEDFRMLCDDYALTASTLRRLQGAGQVSDLARIRDYHEILTGLAREISAALSGAPSP